MHARISLVIMYCGGIAESLDVCILIGNAKNIVFQSDSMMYNYHLQYMRVPNSSTRDTV